MHYNRLKWNFVYKYLPVLSRIISRSILYTILVVAQSTRSQWSLLSLIELLCLLLWIMKQHFLWVVLAVVHSQKSNRQKMGCIHGPLLLKFKGSSCVQSNYSRVGKLLSKSERLTFSFTNDISVIQKIDTNTRVLNVE